MKTVILALVGMVIGGGVGTGGGALLLARCASEEPAAVETDAPEVAAEAASEGDAAPEVDTAHAETLDPDSIPTKADEVASATPVVTDSTETDDSAPPPGAVDPAAPAVEPIVLAPTPDPTALRRLARIFSNMKAEQAAAVMIELTDAEAQRILVSMPERAAAAILNKMEPSRAAVLSRRVLGAGGGGEQ